MKTYIKRILSLVLVAVMLSVWTPFTPAVDNAIGSVYAYAEGEGAEGEAPAGEDPAGEDPAGGEPAGDEPDGTEGEGNEPEGIAVFAVAPVASVDGTWTYDGAAIEDGKELPLLDFDISKLKVSVDGEEKDIVSFNFGSEENIEWTMEKIEARGLGTYTLNTENGEVNPISIKLGKKSISINSASVSDVSMAYVRKVIKLNEMATPFTAKVDGYDITFAANVDAYYNKDGAPELASSLDLGDYSIILGADTVSKVTKDGKDVTDLVEITGSTNGKLTITVYKVQKSDLSLSVGNVTYNGRTYNTIKVGYKKNYNYKINYTLEKVVVENGAETRKSVTLDDIKDAGTYVFTIGEQNWSSEYDFSDVVDDELYFVISPFEAKEADITWNTTKYVLTNGNKMNVPVSFSFNYKDGLLTETIPVTDPCVVCNQDISDGYVAGIEYIFTVDADEFAKHHPNFRLENDLSYTTSGEQVEVEPYLSTDMDTDYNGLDKEWQVKFNYEYDGDTRIGTASITKYELLDDDGNVISVVENVNAAGNYRVHFVLSKDFKSDKTYLDQRVGKKYLVLIVDDATIVYGETFDIPATLINDDAENDLVDLDCDVSDLVTLKVANPAVGTYQDYAKFNEDYLASNPKGSNYGHWLASNGTLTVDKLNIKLVPKAGQGKVYGTDDPTIDYDVVILNENYVGLSEEQIKAELGNAIVRAEGEAVGSYGYDLAENLSGNYKIELDDTNKFEITKAAIVVTPDMNQGKYYGEEDDVITYTFEVVDGANEYSEEELAAIRTELGDIVVRAEGEDVGSYGYNLTVSSTDNLTIVFNNKDEADEYIEYRIYRLPVTISGDAVEKFYGGDDPALTYTVTSVHEDILTADEVAAELGEALLTRDAENENVGTYATYIKSEVIDQVEDNTYAIGNFEVTFTEGSLTIKKLPVVVTPDAGQAKFYGADDVTPYTFTIDWDEEITNLNEDIIRRELTGIGGDMGNMDAPTEGDIVDIVSGDMLKRAEGEKVGFYNYSLVTTDYANYEVTLDTNENAIQYEIKKLPVTVTPDAGQRKYYGGNDPETYTYTVEATEDTKLSDEEIIAEMGAIIDRVYGADAIEAADTYIYMLDAEQVKAACGNYEITFVDGVFTIDPLPVTVTPDAEQSKIYGEVDPENYTYKISWDNTATNLTNDQICEELTAAIVIREEGEDIGAYDYLLNSDVDTSNYDLTLVEDTFAITAHEISVAQIDSRTDILTVSMAGGETFEYKEGVKLYLKIEAELATSETVICVTDELSDFFAYETANEDGSVIVNLGNVGAVLTTDINTVDYDAIAKSGEALVLTGNLPAGTKLTITPVDSAYNAVGAPVELVVGVKAPAPTFVEFEYSHNHVSDASNKLTITGLPGEWVDVVFTAGEEAPAEGENAATYTEYAKHYQLDAEGRCEIPTSDLVVYDGANVHYLQIATVSYVDTLNLAADADSREFIYDTQAFAIPSSNILFANRDTVVNVTLPEVGVITSLEIPGATVVEYPSSASTTHAVTVTWSGMALITSGSEIKVNYTDLGGNANSGIGTVTQSAVTTPLNVKIRPKTNSAGYLGGDKADTLIISGTGCSCEPITVTVSDMDNVIYVTQAEVWTDTEGTFQMSIDMSRLPDGETFNITVEYLDVVGTSAYVTVTYDAECLPAVLAMNSYENMAYLAGFAEPNVAIAFSLNGGALIELEVDRHGRFVMPQVPMMFGGIDTFTIYITDIAGNQWNYTYIVPEVITVDENGNAIPFYLEVPVAPLGAYFYGICDETGEPFYHALTPVDVAELTETGTMELPVLVGTVYEIGKFSVTRTETGIVVNSEITNEQLLADGYEVLSEKLYVFAEKPTAKDVHELEKSIEDGKAVAYTYGEEIAVEADAEIWIMSESEIKILEESTRNFVAYDLESDENYNKFQDAR